MKKLLTFIFAAAFGINSHAETIYVSQTGSGDKSGSTSLNAAPMSFVNTSSNWGSGAGKISAGDTLMLQGVIQTTLQVLGDGASGSPITIAFDTGAKFSKAAWGTGTNSAVYSSGKKYITIDGKGTGLIECLDNGDAKSGATPSWALTVEGGSDWNIQNLNISNIYIHTYGTTNKVTAYTTRGITANSVSNITVANCTISNAYVGIYLLTNGASVDNCTIANNQISSCSTAIIGALGSSGDRLNNVRIYGNDVSMGLNWFDPENNNHVDGIHCWGIAGGTFSNLSVYHNYIHEDPSTHCTSYIYLENQISSPRVFGNTLVGSTNRPAGGYIGIANSSGTTAVFNNTIVGLGSSSAGGIGLYPRGSSAVTFNIHNNIIVNCYAAIYESTGTIPINSDFNCYYGNGYLIWNSSKFTDIVALRAAGTTDLNSLTANPSLTSSQELDATSACLGRGTVSAISVSSDEAAVLGISATFSSINIGAYLGTPVGVGSIPAHDALIDVKVK